MLVRIIRGFFERGEFVPPSDQPIEVSAERGAQLVGGRVAVPVRERVAERAVAPQPPEKAAAVTTKDYGLSGTAFAMDGAANTIADSAGGGGVAEAAVTLPEPEPEPKAPAVRRKARKRG